MPERSHAILLKASEGAILPIAIKGFNALACSRYLFDSRAQPLHDQRVFSRKHGEALVRGRNCHSTLENRFRRVHSASISPTLGSVSLLA